MVSQLVEGLIPKLAWSVDLVFDVQSSYPSQVFLGLAAVRLPGRQRMRNSQAASTLLETSAEGAALGAGEAGQRTPRAADAASAAPGPVASGEGEHIYWRARYS